MTMPWAAAPPPDRDAAEAAVDRRENLPAGALGALGPVVDLLAGARGGQPFPVTPVRPRLAVFAADHGIAAALDISAAAPGYTARWISDLAAGGGLTATLARSAGVGVHAIDIAVAADLSSTAVDLRHRVRASSGRIDAEDALTGADVDAALRAGAAVADAEVDEGADLLIGAVCGAGVSTPTAALVSVLTGMEPVDAASRGSGIDDAAWIRKAGAVRDARRRVQLAGQDVATMLRVAGGADLAALTGFIGRAAARRTPVIVDDVPSALCAVLAERLAPGLRAYLIAAALAPERCHARLLDMLELAPLTAWGIAGGCGTAALLFVPVLRAAAAAVDQADAPQPYRSPSAIRAWDADLL